MNINLNIKIKAGPRTPIEVTVYGTAVNDKTIKFANGHEVKENTICEWLETHLTKALKKIQDE